MVSLILRDYSIQSEEYICFWGDLSPPQRELQNIALHNQSKVTAYFQRISPFRFAGINQQKWKLFKEVNQRRKVAGLARIEWSEAKRWRDD